MNRNTTLVIAAAIAVILLLVVIPWGGSDVEEVDTANPAEALEDATGAVTPEAVDEEAEAGEAAD